MSSKKDRSGPAGPIFKVQENPPRPKRAKTMGAQGRWVEVYAAFDKQAPGGSVGVEVLNMAEAYRLGSALNGHAGVYLRDHPDAGWRLTTTSATMPNGHAWFYAEKRLTTT